MAKKQKKQKKQGQDSNTIGFGLICLKSSSKNLPENLEMKSARVLLGLHFVIERI